MAKVDISDTVEGGDPEGGPQAAMPPVTDQAEDPNPPSQANVPVVVDDLGLPEPGIEVVEATSDEAAEGVDWVRTGWVRLRVRGTDGQIRTYRLRAPLLRELKRLRLSLETAEDEIEVRRSALLRAAAAASVEITKAKDELAEPERSDRIAQLHRDDRKAGREFTAFAEDTRVEWLTEVFTSKLAVDGPPEDFPGYVVHPDFCSQLLQHWRSVPLAPGR